MKVSTNSILRKIAVAFEQVIYIWFYKAITFLLLVLITGSVSLYGQVSSTDYHAVRSNLSNCNYVFEQKQEGHVAFLGGSITYNPGWRDSICVYLQQSYPNTRFECLQAGIPSMGSTPGAFRLERDVLSEGKIDLLFVEAAVNDPTNGRTSEEQIRGLEGIVRHARKDNPYIDIIVMHFVDPDKMKDYNNGLIPEVITNHEKVASHYNVSSINLAKEVTDRINAGEFAWEDDFKNLHPSPFGQMVYYYSIRDFLQNTWNTNSGKGSKRNKYPLPEKLDMYSYERGKLIPIGKASIIKDWEVIPNWNPGQDQNTRKGYVNVPMLVSDMPGSEIQLEFKGKAIGIAVAAGPDAGMIEYRIDGDETKILDLFTKWSSQLHLPWYYVLEPELKRGKHSISIRISEDRNPESIGTVCRIKHFFINE